MKIKILIVHTFSDFFCITFFFPEVLVLLFRRIISMFSTHPVCIMDMFLIYVQNLEYIIYYSPLLVEYIMYYRHFQPPARDRAIDF